MRCAPRFQLATYPFKSRLIDDPFDELPEARLGLQKPFLRLVHFCHVADDLDETNIGPLADEWLGVKPLKPRQKLDYRRAVAHSTKSHHRAPELPRADRGGAGVHRAGAQQPSELQRNRRQAGDLSARDRAAA